MKRYLLIAGATYYLSSGTEDWIACYESLEDAARQVSIDERGYKIGEFTYDWYKIIDLSKWVL